MLMYGSFDVVSDGKISGKKVSFTCPNCKKVVKKSFMKSTDNAGAGFASVRCSCGQLSLFSDQYGNYVHLS